MIAPTLSDKIKALLLNVLTYLRNLIVNPINASLFTYNITQRQTMQTLLDMYAGNQLIYLNAELNKQFINPASLKFQPQVLNIVKKITDDICMTFKNGINIKAVNDADQKIVEKIVDSTNIDSVLQELDRKVYLNKQTFIKINYIQETGDTEGKIKLDIITPQYVDVETSKTDPYTFTAILYPKLITTPSIQMPKGLFCYWSVTEFVVVDESKTPQENPENPDNINPYTPIIPIVTFRESIPTDGLFFKMVPEDLVNAQNSINVKLTMRNQLIKMQSFSIPVITNPALDSSGNTVTIIDASLPLIVHQLDRNIPAGLEFKSPDPKIKDIEDSIDKDLQRIATMYGLDPDDLVASGQKSTADSQNTSNAHLNEIREQRKLIFIPSINELWNKIVIVWNLHNPNDKLSEDGVIITINDPRRSYATTDDYTKLKEFDLKYNMSTPVDWLVEQKDDLTFKEAQEMIIKNAELNAYLSSNITVDSNPSSSFKTTQTGSTDITGSITGSTSGSAAQ
jgi:hypothetical protein